jgi:hypothetical protein
MPISELRSPFDSLWAGKESALGTWIEFSFPACGYTAEVSGSPVSGR